MKSLRRKTSEAISRLESAGFKAELLDNGEVGHLTIMSPTGRIVKRMKDDLHSVASHLVGFAEGVKAMKEKG